MNMPRIGFAHGGHYTPGQTGFCAMEWLSLVWNGGNQQLKTDTPECTPSTLGWLVMNANDHSWDHGRLEQLVLTRLSRVSQVDDDRQHRVIDRVGLEIFRRRLAQHVPESLRDYMERIVAALDAGNGKSAQTIGRSLSAFLRHSSTAYGDRPDVEQYALTSLTGLAEHGGQVPLGNAMHALLVDHYGPESKSWPETTEAVAAVYGEDAVAWLRDHEDQLLADFVEEVLDLWEKAAADEGLALEYADHFVEFVEKLRASEWAELADMALEVEA